jgi:type III pantothenate kinase
LTFTTVTSAGHILGVAIAPGLKTAISALYNSTAQLPEVPLAYPSSAVGKSTVHAIQSGVLIGYVGLVKHMIESIREEVGKDYKAIATGGLASILYPLQEVFDEIDPFLTLHGLRIIGESVF